MKKIYIISLLLITVLAVLADTHHPLDRVVVRMKPANVSQAEMERVCELMDLHIGQPSTSNSFFGGIDFHTVGDTNDVWVNLMYSRQQFSKNGRSPDEPWLSYIQGTNSITNQLEVKVFPYIGNYTNFMSYFNFQENVASE